MAYSDFIAAQIFNQRSNQQQPVIYGVVTSGSVWRFLKLQETIATIDLTEYYIDRVDRISGVLITAIRSNLPRISPSSR
jgi:hypothetical protein